MKLKSSQKRILVGILAIGFLSILIWVFKEGRDELEKERERERPVEAEAHVFKEEGKVIIDLNEETQKRSGVVVVPIEPMTYQKGNSQEERQGVLIPRSAIVWLDGGPFVYVQEEEDHFAREEVLNYIPVKGGWFVSEKFKQGERIVVSGAQMLLSTEFRDLIKVGEEEEGEEKDKRERGHEGEKEERNKEKQEKEHHEKKPNDQHEERD